MVTFVEVSYYVFGLHCLFQLPKPSEGVGRFVIQNVPLTTVPESEGPLFQESAVSEENGEINSATEHLAGLSTMT